MLPSRLPYSQWGINSLVRTFCLVTVVTGIELAVPARSHAPCQHPVHLSEQVYSSYVPLPGIRCTVAVFVCVSACLLRARRG